MRHNISEPSSSVSELRSPEKEKRSASPIRIRSMSTPQGMSRRFDNSLQQVSINICNIHFFQGIRSPITGYHFFNALFTICALNMLGILGTHQLIFKLLTRTLSEMFNRRKVQPCQIGFTEKIIFTVMFAIGIQLVMVHSLYHLKTYFVSHLSKV